MLTAFLELLALTATHHLNHTVIPNCKEGDVKLRACRVPKRLWLWGTG